MLKILTTKQIKALDAYTIEHEPIVSIDLMERASNAFVHWFVGKFDTRKKVGVVCGTGNNGGDGLAIARLLTEWNYSVDVYIVRAQTKETEDFQKNVQRLPKQIEVREITSAPDSFSKYDVLIDAIFGSGLTRPVDGLNANVIDVMNQSKAICVAVDIPSGLSADSTSSGTIVKADFTVSFQLPKLAFLLPENGQYLGVWTTVNIGLSKEFIKGTSTELYLLTGKDIKKIIKPRSKFDHKGNYGHALLIAGSYGKMGACVLSAKAALRSGVGLLTVHVPKNGYAIIQTAVPEAMVSIDVDDEFVTSIPDTEKYNATGIGPGIGQSPETIKALSVLLTKSTKPLVVDADALNILASHRELLHSIPEKSILTPHPKEFERLVGNWKNDFERLEKLKEFSKQLKSIVILKGAYSAVATPDGSVYFNSTGNPGMATGGSGDVLTGILTGLLAQGYTSEDAAKAGVYLHGLAGDLAAQEKGMHGLIASDLIDFLPYAFSTLDK
ncbi:MAG TPA: NAD(P)H-hydrate dehydratase [Cyclobacteriaceae bacterium]|jgi:NAD(P)H-hydrate epimerase|nr:NAD(P)H-hydrate dehydratase [Cyclobacteriaceae bacterium]